MKKILLLVSFFTVSVFAMEESSGGSDKPYVEIWKNEWDKLSPEQQKRFRNNEIVSKSSQDPVNWKRSCFSCFKFMCCKKR